MHTHRLDSIARLACLLLLISLAGCAGANTASESPAADRPQATQPQPAADGPAAAPSTPLDVRLHMDVAPKRGAQAEVTLELRSAADAPQTTARIELPAGARLVSGPLEWSGDLKAGDQVSFSATIVIEQAGQHTIQGRALSTLSPDMTWGDLDAIHLTVAEDSGNFGFTTTNPAVTGGPER